MDAGVFVQSKVRLGLWIIVPLLLIAGLQVGVRTYARHAEDRLRESRDLMNVMPEMEVKLASARSVIGRFGVEAEGAVEASELVRRRVTMAGQQSGLVINSLSVEKESQPLAGRPISLAAARAAASLPAGAESVRVSVSGVGPLAAMIRFLDQLQGPESLATIESASVRTMDLVTEPMYAADLVMRYCVVGL